MQPSYPNKPNVTSLKGCAYWIDSDQLAPFDLSRHKAKLQKVLPVIFPGRTLANKLDCFWFVVVYYLDRFVLIVQHRDFSRFKYVARLCDLVTRFSKKLIHDLF